MDIRVRSDLSQQLATLERHFHQQIPFAASRAINLTAKDVQGDLRKEMERVFDRPTRWTLNSLFMKPATKANLHAKVWIKDQFFYNGRGESHLHPHIFGGARGVKRLEQHLHRRGLLPGGLSVVPGSAAHLDSHGNMGRGQVQRVLSALQAHHDPAQNRPARGAASPRRGRRGPRAEYFVGRPGNRSPLGVWQRVTFAMGSAVKPILIFVRRPHYRTRYRFYEVAQATIQRSLAVNARRAIAEAVATAR